MKKLISLMLVLSMLISLPALICSCGSDSGEGGSKSADLTLISEGNSEYVIVRAESADKVVRDAVSAFKKAIREAYGAEITATTDYVFRNETDVVIPDLEIIIGNANREEVAAVTAEVPESGFLIKSVGKKLVILGASDALTAKGVEYFIQYCIVKGETSLTLAADYSRTGYPDYSFCLSTGKTYVEMADEVYASFRKKYWQSRANWVTGSGFWDAAEILETFIDAYDSTGRDDYLEYAEKYAAGFITKNGSNWLSNKYNDDIMWITIAYLRLYLITKNNSYYRQAKSMYDGVYKRGWSSDLGGGIWWTTDNNTKNSCVNCPAAIAACYIYQISESEQYLDQAKAIIDWEVDNLYETNGHVYDSYPVSGEKNTWASTYNQGTFIGACTLIYQLSGEEKYIGYANAAKDYTMNNMFSGGVMNSEDGNQDLVGFKGILTRWIYRYAIFMNDLEVLEWLQLNAAAAYSHQNKDGLIWTAWNNKTSDTYSDNQVVFGFSTAVALMFNSLQWWESTAEE